MDLLRVWSGSSRRPSPSSIVLVGHTGRVDNDPLLDEGAPVELVQQLRQVAQAQQRADAAQRDLEVATEELADAVALHGFEQHGTDTPVPSALLDALYWDTPSLPVKTIATAYGMRSVNDVSAAVAARTVAVSCVDCGTEGPTSVVRTRTALAQLRRTFRCDPCTETAALREQRRHEIAATERRRRDQVHAEQLEDAMRNYVIAHPELPELPDDGPIDDLWLSIPVPAWGHSTVSLSALHRVRREVAETLARLADPYNARP